MTPQDAISRTIAAKIPAPRRRAEAAGRGAATGEDNQCAPRCAYCTGPETD